MIIKGPLWVGSHIMKSQPRRHFCVGTRQKTLDHLTRVPNEMQCVCCGDKQSVHVGEMRAMLAAEAAPSEGWNRAMASALQKGGSPAHADGNVPHRLAI